MTPEEARLLALASMRLDDTHLHVVTVAMLVDETSVSAREVAASLMSLDQAGYLVTALADTDGPPWGVVRLTTAGFRALDEQTPKGVD